MADISKIKTPNGTTYDIVDHGARELIAASQIINSASGAIVSFSDGADDIPFRSLSVDLEPVQDLHGQDSPYPAGAINKWDEEWISNGSRIESKNLIPVLPNTTYAWVSPNQPANGLRFYDANKTLLSTVYSVSSGVFTTPSDCYYIWFALGSAYGNTYNHDVSINYPSTITTYHPYSNICPISGRTGADIEHTGVNIWDEEWEVGGLSTADGQPSGNNNTIRSKNFILCLPNTAYYTKSVNLACYLWFYDGDKNFISFVTNNVNKAVTTPSNCRYMKLRVGDSKDPLQTYNHDVSINYPSTDYDYHPYTGRSITIDLGQTVYGGKLDVLSGELTVDRAMVDLGTLNYSYSQWGTNYQFTNSFSNMKVNPNDGALGNIMCSMYPNVVPRTMYRDTMNYAIAQNRGMIRIVNTDYTDAASFKTAMSGVQLVYELATPQTYHLTPQEVRTLLGTNNVWSDADSIFVEYDTKNSVVAFTSSDVADGDASSWTTVTKVASGEKRSSLFAKMSQMFKNVRYLHKLLGTTDISSIGDGTVTGGLSSLSESQQAQKQLYIQQLKDLCLFAEIANGS